MMARCGFCKTDNLHHDTSKKDGQGLESHYLPNTRKTCEGPITSSYTGKQSRSERQMMQKAS